MSLAVQILDPRHDEAPADWPALTDGKPVTWRYELLRAFAWAGQAPLLLAVVRDGAAPRAVLSVSLRGFPPARGRYADAGRPAGIIDVHAPGSRSQKGWWFVGDPAPAEREELLRCAVRGLRRALGPGWRALMWREVSYGERPPGTLRVSLPTSPLARLATPWPELSGWYATLPAGRGGTLRSQARKLAADRRLSVATGPAKGLVSGLEAVALRARNDVKYRNRLLPAAPLPLAYVEAMVTADEVTAITYRDQDDRLLGLCLILDDSRWPIFHSWGALPVEAGGRRHLYFDAYVRMVEWAIETGRAGLVLGKGQRDVKRELGAELVGSSVVVVPV